MVKRSSKKHECQNCGARLSDREIVRPSRIPDYFERVAPGEIAPSGACKRCGALTQLIRPVGIIGELVRASKRALERFDSLLDASDPETPGERRTLKLDERAAIRLREALDAFK